MSRAAWPMKNDHPTRRKDCMSNNKYGEPWEVDLVEGHPLEATIYEKDSSRVTWKSAEGWPLRAERIKSCINALAGIEDPQTALDEARKALAHYAASKDYKYALAALELLTPKP